MRHMILCLALIIASLTLSGCATYYAISDPSTGKTYYTQNYEIRNGATHFEDARTGTEVNIQNSEIREISEDDYNIAVK